MYAVTDRAESITLVRQPARVTVATLSELEAVAVDGEPVPADAKSESVWGRRYRRRVAALIAAGYLIPAPGGVAPAGDTVEIVRVVDGRGHGHVAGVRIRASARFCAAYQDQVKTRLPAARLFTP